MPARYLIRFDDICPTMNWGVWDRIETLLDLHGIKPIVAVVPDNQDAKLHAQQPNDAFWSRVRRWQDKGWTIGLHGHRHVYDTQDAGIVGLNAYSEFAGHARERQVRKLEAALDIMGRENVRPKLWAAPAHSFDAVTLDILKEHGLCVVSDGMYLRPVKDRTGIVWIPQQTWRFRSMPFGTWTVCCHHSLWGAGDIERFEDDLRRYREKIVAVDDILGAGVIADRRTWDVVLSKIMLAAMKSRQVCRRRRQG